MLCYSLGQALICKTYIFPVAINARNCVNTGFILRFLLININERRTYSVRIAKGKWTGFAQWLCQPFYAVYVRNVYFVAESVSLLEWEKDNRIPFLDVLVIRSPTGYKFTVYRKPTFSISYIHFYSYHDHSVKVSLASNLFLRALRICSNDHLDSEFDIIKQHLKSVKYPDHIIEKAIYKANQIFFRPNQQERDSFNNKINIPYIDSIKRLTEPLGKSSPFSFSYPNTIGSSLVNIYQKKTKNETGVYTIPCHECNKTYVGFTNKGLSQRIIEYKRSV